MSDKVFRMVGPDAHTRYAERIGGGKIRMWIPNRGGTVFEAPEPDLRAYMEAPEWEVRPIDREDSPFASSCEISGGDSGNG